MAQPGVEGGYPIPTLPAGGCDIVTDMAKLVGEQFRVDVVAHTDDRDDNLCWADQPAVRMRHNPDQPPFIVLQPLYIGREIFSCLSVARTSLRIMRIIVI